MNEKNLLKAVKEERRVAIYKADEACKRRLVKAVSNSKRFNPLLIFAITLLLIFLICLGIFIYIIIPQKIAYETIIKQPIIQREVIIEKPIIQRIEITQINKTEISIKGQGYMTCLEKPNSKEVICYKNEK